MKTQTYHRIEEANKRVKELDALLFTNKEMRGLSKVEKDFIIENDYHVKLIQSNVIGTNGTLYMFIAKNLLGKKQLYAITKYQSINPNGKDIAGCESGNNYDVWLLFDARYGRFSKFYYERRFCTIPNRRLIFA
jgi:hypothetical protein